MSHRRFVLQRDVDVTGVSGTGIVAEGVEFSDGPVALRWITEWPTSVVFHDRGMKSVAHVHGHSGATRIVWLDPSEFMKRVESLDPDEGFDNDDAPGLTVAGVAKKLEEMLYPEVQEGYGDKAQVEEAIGEPRVDVAGDTLDVEIVRISTGTYDKEAMVWRCDGCNGVLEEDYGCPRCDPSIGPPCKDGAPNHVFTPDEDGDRVCGYCGWKPTA